MIDKQNNNQQQERNLLGIDFGNTSIRIYHKNKKIVMYNSLSIENQHVYINKKPSISCLIDSTLLSSVRYQDKKYQQIFKYYNYIFKKGKNNSLLVKFHHKTTPEEIYVQFAFYLMIKGVFRTNPYLNLLMVNEIKFKTIITIFQGQLNPFRLSLRQALKCSNIHDIHYTSVNNCIVTAYLQDIKGQKHRDYTQIVGVVDFSDKGLSIKIYKIYSTPVGVIEVLSSDCTYVGGNVLTNILVDHVVKQLIAKKSMDISKISKFMQKLKILCNQAKHTLSSSDTAYVRLDNLPDILTFGCEITESQYEKLIQKSLKINVDLIKQAIQKYSTKINKVILHGGSCKIPSFKRMLKKQIQSIKFVDSWEQSVRQGILLIRSGKFHIIDLTNFDLRMQGDQKFACKIYSKNQQLPLRKNISMRFPSGQFTYSIRFYQSDVLIATCFIPQRPRQSKYNLYVEVDKNKILKIYATNSFGLIKMNINMMEIGAQEFMEYDELTKNFDYHNQND